jgi:hypothetical protein
MAIAGAILLMVRYRAINPKFAEDWEEDYRVGENARFEDDEAESAKLVEETESSPQPSENSL